MPSMIRAGAVVALAASAVTFGGCTFMDKSDEGPTRVATHWGVRSSLPEEGTLPARAPWTAEIRGLPAARVSTVGFYIDGRLAWVQSAAPYVFGGTGNVLDTTMLSAKTHTFAIKVAAADGTSASTQSIGLVGAAPAPPKHLAGVLRRAVPKASVERTGATVSSEFPRLLAGVWQAEIDRHGLHLRAPDGHRYGLRLTAHGGPRFRGPLTVGGAFVNPETGETAAICPPGPAGRYRWRAKGGKLRLRVVEDPCAARRAVLEGSFDRVSAADASA